mmetsp:Transcript_25985/g.45253  ORF Transcript_25985/g.45253 Transcript_25985/m.45253 type:complete len:138 (+) Transcript_25985:64-477(+)
MWRAVHQLARAAPRPQSTIVARSQALTSPVRALRIKATPAATAGRAKTASDVNVAREGRNQYLDGNVQQPRPLEADSRILLVGGALACFFGSITAVYVAVSHDPNKKEDRPILKRGEYIAGASVVGAITLVFVATRS